MNRQQRRRAGRQVVRGDVYQLQGLGTSHHVKPMAEFPPKVDGRHRWIATGGYTLSDFEAAAGIDGTGQVILSPTKLVAFSVGCVDCEQEYRACRGAPCPAGDEWSRA